MPRRTALVYPATPVTPPPPVDLTDRATRERLSGPALRAFFNVMARWEVKDDDARQLLGGVTNGPYYEMKRSPDRLLDVDRLTRVSLVVGIFKALGLLYSDALADRWVHLPNTNRLFAGGDAARLHDPGRRPGAPDGPAPARRAAGRLMRLPPVAALDQRDTHRLVPSRYLAPRRERPRPHRRSRRRRDTWRRSSSSTRATNDRLLAERGLLPGIGPDELVAAVPLASVDQRRLLSRAPARLALRRRRPRRLVRRLRDRDRARRGRLPQVGGARRDRLARRVDHLRRLPGRLRRRFPRSARRGAASPTASRRPATWPRRRWRRGSSRRARWAWSIRACDATAARASRASGRRSSPGSGGRARGASPGPTARGRASSRSRCGRRRPPAGLVPGGNSHGYSTATTTSGNRRHRQRRALASFGVEVVRGQPRLERRLPRRPVTVDHREPRRVARAALHDHVLAEDALEREAEARGGAARRLVQRVALPLVAAVAERLEGVARHQVHGFSRAARALQRGVKRMLPTSMTRSFGVMRRYEATPIASPDTRSTIA